MSVDDLTTRQRRALLVLLAGGTQEDAAGAAGVRARQVRRWLDRADFSAALAEAERGVFTGAARGLQHELRGAISTLAELHKDPECPPAVRRAAASDLVSHALRLHDAVLLSERLAEVEARLDGRAYYGDDQNAD